MRRVALVIGNDAYLHVPALHNAGNDAAAMARELAGLGFEVLSFKDLDRSGMNRAITQFVGRVSEGAVALFFYAGHGVQIRGANYLIPIDLRAEDENTLVRIADSLRNKGASAVGTFLLREGFDLKRSENLAQSDWGLG